jgi:hypothetical protein
MSICDRRIAGIVDGVAGVYRPVRIVLTTSFRIGLTSLVVVRPKASIGLRVAVGLHIARRGHRGDSHVVANLSPFRLNLANLRDRQRTASIGPDSFLLPGERRSSRRRSVLHNDDAILHDDRRSISDGGTGSQNSLPGRCDGRRPVGNASRDDFALIHDDCVP